MAAKRKALDVLSGKVAAGGYDTNDDTKCASDTVPFPEVIEKNRGDDGTRIRGLCRDSGPLIGFTTTYKNAGTAKDRLSH